jgi:hypothetical protein
MAHTDDIEDLLYFLDVVDSISVPPYDKVRVLHLFSFLEMSSIAIVNFITNHMKIDSDSPWLTDYEVCLNEVYDSISDDSLNLRRIRQKFTRLLTYLFVPTENDSDKLQAMFQKNNQFVLLLRSMTSSIPELASSIQDRYTEYSRRKPMQQLSDIPKSDQPLPSTKITIEKKRDYENTVSLEIYQARLENIKAMYRFVDSAYAGTSDLESNSKDLLHLVRIQQIFLISTLQAYAELQKRNSSKVHSDMWIMDYITQMRTFSLMLESQRMAITDTRIQYMFNNVFTSLFDVPRKDGNLKMKDDGTYIWEGMEDVVWPRVIDVGNLRKLIRECSPFQSNFQTLACSVWQDPNMDRNTLIQKIKIELDKFYGPIKEEIERNQAMQLAFAARRPKATDPVSNLKMSKLLRKMKELNDLK